MHRFFVFLALGLAIVARAQDPVPLDGSWTAKWTTPQGQPAQADVTIKGQEGTWNRFGGNARSDRCIFREVPITVQSSNAEEVTIELLRAKALQGCVDEKHTFRRVDDKTLERTLRDGSTMRLTR